MEFLDVFEVLEGCGAPKGREFLHLSDGRTMLWWRNVHTSGDANKLALYIGMVERGVLDIREEDAKNIFGNVIDDSVVFRVDARIGKELASKLRHFVMDRFPGVMDTVSEGSTKHKPELIEELLDQGMAETGLDRVVEELRGQQIAKPLGTLALPIIPDRYLDL